MLDHIQYKNQVKKVNSFSPEIRELELQPLIRSCFREFDSLWRYIVTPEIALALEVLLELFQYFSGAASHFADCLGGKMILAEHAQNVGCLPSAFFNMPPRIHREVLAVEVDCLTGHAGSRPTTARPAVPWSPAPICSSSSRDFHFGLPTRQQHTPVDLSMQRAQVHLGGRRKKVYFCGRPKGKICGGRGRP